MVNFEQARTSAFESLSKTNTIEKVKVLDETLKGRKFYRELWKILVEVDINEKFHDFTFLINIKYDFPLSLPKIYLSEADYEAIKYIPHVDTSRNICLFDQENIKIDTSKPVEIIRACLRRAVEIIRDGINKTNNADFNDEIVAYWENKYTSKDKISTGYLGECSTELVPGKITVDHLIPAYSDANIILGNGTNYDKLINFLKLKQHRINKQNAFFLGSVTKLEPPFHYNNKLLLKFIKENFSNLWSEVVSYLNCDFNTKTFIFSVQSNSETIFLGFVVLPLLTNFRGWRKKSLTTFTVMSSLDQYAPVNRLLFEPFTKSRLERRTDGSSVTDSGYKLMIAGLGSIGSNLIFYLSGLNLSKLILVDPDILTLANVNRHLLSFNDVGKFKVSGIASYLSGNFPFLETESYAESIISTLNKCISKINEMDFLFFAIGKDSIDSYIIQCLNDGTINKPVFILWVEPYLLGAHVLYINPDTDFSLDKVEVDEYYKYNIISPDSYNDKNNQLMLREAGCQGSYIPFGREVIMRFYSSFLPDLFSTIRERPNRNIVWTYSGDLTIASDRSIKISTFGNVLSSHQIIKHYL